MGDKNIERLVKTMPAPTFDNAVTASAGITATTGGVTATAGGVTATAGNITATAGDIVATAGDITATAGDVNVTAGDVNIVAGMLNLGAATELTIASGVVTATHSRHYIDTESDGASDDLDTISGGTDGDILILMAANDARTVNVTAAGNIVAGANPRALDASEDTLTLMYDGGLSKWVEIAFISNAS